MGELPGHGITPEFTKQQAWRQRQGSSHWKPFQLLNKVSSQWARPLVYWLAPIKALANPQRPSPSAFSRSKMQFWGSIKGGGGVGANAGQSWADPAPLWASVFLCVKWQIWTGGSCSAWVTLPRRAPGDGGGREGLGRHKWSGTVLHNELCPPSASGVCICCSVAQSCLTLCDPMDYSTSLSITNSWGLFKFMSTESVMPSNHLILCRPLLLLPSSFPSIKVFYSESAFCIM